MIRNPLHRLVLLWLIPWWLPLLGIADDRIMVPATINGQSAQLAFATGSDFGFTLYSSTVEKFGLEIEAPAAGKSTEDGAPPLVLTRPTAVEVLGQSIERPFAVLETPPGVFPDFDGLLGWPAVDAHNWLLLLAEQKLMPAGELSAEFRSWPGFRICREYDRLVIELPAVDEESEPVLLVLDTASQRGVALPPSRWAEWRSAHRAQSETITSQFAQDGGLTVGAEAWADTLTLNEFVLNGVPVCEGTPHERTLSGADVGAVTLGLAALRRIDVAIDAASGTAYLRARNDPPPPYAHNRLGAVFVPADETSDDLVARVLPYGPAYRTAIRDGDVLLKVNNFDVTQWRTNPRLQLARLFELPAGTRLRLTLRRGEQTITKSVFLQDMIGPREAR